MNDETKTCANEACAKPFARRTRTRETKAAFAERKYCCRDCKYEAERAERNADPAGTKTCKRPGCGREYTKRPRESRNEFMKRSFCCIDCRYKADTGGHRRVQRRPSGPEFAVTRAPGQPWRPAGWARKPNVFGTVRQGC